MLFACLCSALQAERKQAVTLQLLPNESSDDPELMETYIKGPVFEQLCRSSDKLRQHLQLAQQAVLPGSTIKPRLDVVRAVKKGNQFVIHKGSQYKFWHEDKRSFIRVYNYIVALYVSFASGEGANIEEHKGFFVTLKVSCLADLDDDSWYFVPLQASSWGDLEQVPKLREPNEIVLLDIGKVLDLSKFASIRQLNEENENMFLDYQVQRWLRNCAGVTFPDKKLDVVKKDAFDVADAIVVDVKEGQTWQDFVSFMREQMERRNTNVILRKDALTLHIDPYAIRSRDYSDCEQYFQTLKDEDMPQLLKEWQAEYGGILYHWKDGKEAFYLNSKEIDLEQHMKTISEKKPAVLAFFPATAPLELVFDKTYGMLSRHGIREVLYRMHQK